jgi:hypothetical protein
MTFPDDLRLRRAASLCQKRYPNYHLRYFDYVHDNTPPLFQFLIIDDVEVLMPVYTDVSGGGTYVTIKNPTVTEVVRRFFEIAWKQATVIKDERQTGKEVLRNLMDRRTPAPSASVASKRGKQQGGAAPAGAIDQDARDQARGNGVP